MELNLHILQLFEYISILMNIYSHVFAYACVQTAKTDKAVWVSRFGLVLHHCIGDKS